ncbi:hypothetical protein H2200_002204 [Cladophialophora chaetospira]|uniref:Carbonic anhydrase n=1 Tax=Cladophialophora chaetospira TaxID=386627 RepID=A0AA38XIM8_9EURO|nr:hypothetical protein H2200_002204 [Cladophialophora chaetospira]
MVSTVEKLLARNSEYAKSHTRFPTFAEFAASGLPAPRTVILTCSDPRCIPEKFFQLNLGEALVIRNLGGYAENALPTILGADTFVHFTEILVVKHTDCGGLIIRNANVKDGLKKLAPHSHEAIEDMRFGEITTSLEENAERDVASRKASEFLRTELKERVFGFVYDLETGRVEPTAGKA